MSSTPGEINCISALVDEDGYYPSHSFFTIISEDKKLSNYVLCALINSKIINAYVRKECVKRTLTTSVVQNIPILEFSDTQIKEIERCCLSIKEAYALDDKEKVEEIQERIDDIIFDAFDLEQVEYLKNDTNNTSIVCLLENDVCNVLFSGDLEECGWENLLERMPELKCEVLKMLHHGAFYDEKNGIGLKRILEILKPKDVIISSGDNKKYKHPAMQTIELLKEKKIKVYCTEFTSLCHCNVNEFNRKCYGDIEIAVTDTAYEIRTETENLSLLNHIACQE